MFERSIDNQTIALAGVYQSCLTVSNIAWKGIYVEEDFNPLISSVLKIDSKDIADIYIGLKHLKPGLMYLRKQLVGDAFSRDAEVTRYFDAINILVRNMNKKNEIISNLRDELSNHTENVTEDNLHEHAEFLSNLYLSTISKINPRIIVNGDNKHLTDNKNASMIRALLLSAIRSYILWQQSGGTKFRIFLFKKKIAEIAITV